MKLRCASRNKLLYFLVLLIKGNFFQCMKILNYYVIQWEKWKDWLTSSHPVATRESNEANRNLVQCLGEAGHLGVGCPAWARAIRSIKWKGRECLKVRLPFGSRWHRKRQGQSCWFTLFFLSLFPLDPVQQRPGAGASPVFLCCTLPKDEILTQDFKCLYWI